MFFSGLCVFNDTATTEIYTYLHTLSLHDALPISIVHDVIVPARAPWLHHIAAGQTLRIVDLEGNQAVDFLVYSAEDDAERYRSEEHTSELQSLMRISYAVFCLKKKKKETKTTDIKYTN